MEASPTTASNTTPLLSQSPDAPEKIPSLDQTIEKCIGRFGFAQLLQATLVSVACVFDSQQTFISVFTDVEPTWHCTGKDSSCNSRSNICHLPRDSWAWDSPLRTSIVSEWGLECATSLLKGLPASSFFFGCLIGGLVLATLADSRLGRKNLLFLSCLLMSSSSLLTTLSTNMWIYSALKFVSGVGRATIGTCSLVLATELVGKRYRGQVGVFGFFCFTLGFLSLPSIGYINRGSSWRILYLWTSLPCLVYCVFVCLLVRESPRWLFVRGRKEEAVSTLKSIASEGITMSFSNVAFEQESWNVDTYSAIKILLQKKWSCRRLCGIVVVAFGIGLVYYGMPLNLGNLAFNLYLSVVVNALSELPSSLLTSVLIDRINRRHALLVFTLVSGICSVLCVPAAKVSTVLEMGLELVSFFCACTGYNVAMIYTIELFPTCVRNSALSMARQSVVFAGVFSPLLVAASAGGGNGFMSYGIFGVVIGVCGLSVVWLPETKGKILCDTMDEEERKEICSSDQCA